MHKRKLIEVALPLEAINKESAREKSIRHGHPSTLHLWWARRPLAAARAVLFAQLVDDPSSNPDRFPTEEAQRVERERLHGIIERLVVWENIRDEKLLAEAHSEILNSSNGEPPTILDPFAGGGTIPLEAQRLGLAAHASDLNPVAVLINKALIEIPPKFRSEPPIFPGFADSQIRNWKGAEGLAADVRAYGRWMRDEAEKRLGHLYPEASLPGGGTAPAIAWIWARTITCPNPACGIDMPLVRSWWLGRKHGKEAYVKPSVVSDDGRDSGLRVSFEVVGSAVGGPARESDGTVGRTGATCIACGTSVPLSYIREEGRDKRIASEMIAVVAEGQRRRIYCAVGPVDRVAAEVAMTGDSIAGSLGFYPRDLKAPTYGFAEFRELFTKRQLLVLTVLSDLVMVARERVRADGGSAEYSDAVATYLGFGVSKAADMNNQFVSWKSSMDQAIHLFTRQAIPMTWDFAEAPPLSTEHGGGFVTSIGGIAKALEALVVGQEGTVEQQDASSRDYGGVVINTDPPYYDNIGYSDLSDFFYVWLRRSLRPIHNDLLSTMLVPKAEELVANRYRHGGKRQAQTFFEEGFRRVFELARHAASDDFPIAVWYAFKQSETDDRGEASTGWETLLDGMIRAGWTITATWPSRSEMGNRMMALDMNALASSIVLSLRPRSVNAPTTDRRSFIAALAAELPSALRKLQQGQIAPVDLPQAAIGPGMAVFSRFSAVLEPDGTQMTIRAALSRINEILDEVLNEQEGDFDPTSRFAIAWYRQHGYGPGMFGDADNLARARNTSVDVMDHGEILTSRAGTVQLIKPADLPWDYDIPKGSRTSNWESLHYLIRVLEQDGIAPAGDLLQAALSRLDGAVDADLVKELAHLLFRIAEGNGWTKDALSFNSLVTSWPEILEVARSAEKPSTQTQGAFDFDDWEE